MHRRTFLYRTALVSLGSFLPLLGRARDTTIPTWESLVDWARWAPSVHNLQPHRLKIVSETEAILCYDPKFLLPVGDPKSDFATAAMGIGIGLVSFAPTRNLVEKRLPKPGEGPDEAARIRGFFEMFIHASHPDHAEKDLRVKVTGDRDPGYGSTSKMLAESAICLALDEKLSAGGIWTPSSALGSLLIDRLIKNAGLSFELVPID